MDKFTADFETATWLEDRTYVWAWATCSIDNENKMEYGNNIDSFMNWCYKNRNSRIYFHNLKFDGEFIIYWLIKHGYKYVEKKEDIENNTFGTCINDMGQFYNITIYYKKLNKRYEKITFIDSLKIIPFSVDKVAKCFGLEINKLKIDYDKVREENKHIMTKEEKDYIKNDVLIMAKALKVLFDEGLEQLTQGANAVKDYKKIINRNFSRYFPILEKNVDEDIRESYKGGFTYVQPEYQEKNVGKGVVIDVNSLYPSVMYNEKIPYGQPVYFEGEYEKDVIYDLYIQKITCAFELKENKIPTIQIKNRFSGFVGNEYLRSSYDEVSKSLKLVSLTLTNIDLELFKEQYNTYDITYEGGWKFLSKKGMFSEYIEKWMEIKKKSSLEGNAGMRTLAKLMLNSLYGKLATALTQKSKVPYLGEDDIVHYKTTDEKDKKGFYIPAGSFITSYARNKTIRTSQKIMDYSIEKYGENKYIYSDTDSIHCLLTEEEIKNIVEIDDVELR